ncbi:large ribosomal subunit assembling protein, putative [Hepatocystis sp. ex Piliocolobus tephrosceles]|nr:large ribosomal subunit assembling protein, putative [Hepatocystis sp. ex Piliocolobus tephrosceles]
MRTLTEQETMIVFKKLSIFVGSNLLSILSNNSERYVLRMHKFNIYLVRDDIAKHAQSINKNSLVSLGTCLGNLTKANNFLLKITSLPILNDYCIHKIWLKETGEKNFLFGNNVIKAHILKISDNIKNGDGVLVLSMNDNPVGFGISTRSTQDLKLLYVTDTVLIHQADVGEYLRNEAHL